MVAKALKLLSAEWKPSLYFIIVIIALGCLSLFVLKAAIFRIILFCIGLDVYNGYFIYIGKSLKGEKIDNPYKFILFGKDSNRYDFIILLVFFGSILLIFKGPMILFQVLFAEKLKELLLSFGQGIIIFNIIVLIGYTAYKISLYSAVSSITYHRNEVLESFKTGIKGIWRFKLLLFILFLFEIAISFLLVMQNTAINNAITLAFYVIPAIIMLLMSCSYYLADTQISLVTAPAVNDDKRAVPNKSLESDA
jgi:hypothetical protein